MSKGESTEPPASWASSPATRASMQANRGRDTEPELIIRRRLHALGLRFRVSTRPVPTVRRTADIVFPRWKVAVFIDGCFWHGCTEHYQAPVRNSDYWSRKVARNRARDLDTDNALRAAGWQPIRIWEHEVRDDPGAVTARVVIEVNVRREAAGTPHTRSRTPGARPDPGAARAPTPFSSGMSAGRQPDSDDGPMGRT